MKAVPGSVVSLYYDSPRDLAAGNVLLTPTGRAYQILELRRQARGRHVGRWHLKALVLEKIPPGATTYPIYWYRRLKRRRS